MEKTIYLYFKKMERTTIDDFFSIFKDITLSWGENDWLQITSFQDDFSIEEVRELLVSELFIDLIAFDDFITEDFPISEVLDWMIQMNPGIYTMKDILPKIVYQRQTPLLNKLKQYYVLLCGQEVVFTVLKFIELNQNASHASKQLYMHRNTLNYRLDLFVSKTNIDIRSFLGAYAIYSLFQH